MRSDWDERAHTDAEHFIYTRDNEEDVDDFDRSGKANYDQLIRPYIPLLLGGRDAADCRAVEIGCGAGRMTQWLADAFGEVQGLDVSPRMLQLASERLTKFANVNLTLGDGESLAPLPSDHFDLAFSYIVFQHIPSREIIAGYVGEVARVLRDGGAFKFQVGGVVGAEHRSDTWHGVALSLAEVSAMLSQAGLVLVSAEGEGTQLFVITARKGRLEEGGMHILPASEQGAGYLTDGWLEPVDGSWRSVEDGFGVRLSPLGGERGVLYLGIYLWPEDIGAHAVAALVDDEPVGEREMTGSGDHFLEFPAPAHSDGVEVEVRFEIRPSLRRRPACRILGHYIPVR
jgi:SAM-dependent methyltransferase